jgi:integrase
MTFGELFSAYRASLGVRPSVKRYLEIYHQYFKAWDAREINTITRSELLYFRQQYRHTPEQCRKGLGLVRQMYNWARNTIHPQTMQCVYEGQNPALGISPPASLPRERLMDLSEIKALLTSLDFLSLKYQAFLLTRLLAAGRILELCTMRRDSVNLHTGKWFKETTKSGRPQYMHIPARALTFLQALPVEGEYFFMGFYGKPLQPASARKVWARFRLHLDMPDVWLLDFRRTLASYLYMQVKADDLTVKAVLNHYDPRPVAIYTRLDYDYLKEVMEAYAEWIWKLKPMQDGVDPPQEAIRDVPGCPPTRPLVTTASQ